MARDFEDVNDIGDLSDGELRTVVREHLAAHNALDIDDLTVEVDHGTVILGGRVGTEGEKLVAEHVVTDIVGVSAVRNEIFVDPIRRAESPEAIDEHLVDDDRRSGLLLGDRPRSVSDETADLEPAIDTELFGTTDVHSAIADGTSWIPPESPTQEGNAEGVD
jgi:BON domain-containing protein